MWFQRDGVFHGRETWKQATDLEAGAGSREFPSSATNTKQRGQTGSGMRLRNLKFFPPFPIFFPSKAAPAPHTAMQPGAKHSND